MFKFKLFAVSFVWFLLNSTVSFAQSVEQSCTPNPFSVIYINGIDNDQSQAKSNFEFLKRSVGSTRNGESIRYALAYNPTRGFWSDLGNVLFDQKPNEYPGVSTDLLVRAFLTGVVSNLIPEGDRERLEKDIKDTFINRIKDKGFVSYEDQDLASITGFINSANAESQKLLLVPHSQGNLYANAAYAKVTSGNNPISQQSIAIMGIATPASFVAGQGGDYVTSINDEVINGLRLVFTNTLGGNFTIARSLADVKGHSMTDIYLSAKLTGRTEVLNKIRNSLDSLVATGGQGDQGPITVTMVWGSNPDVDLHVFEPDGFQVFYAARQGRIGFLDVDDRSSFGPEHYYTDCRLIQEGTYRIAVNYFSGSTPESATITVNTPTASKTLTQELPVSLGAAGNRNPISVATVTVSKAENGTLSYQIQ